jgi:hypothetical protein
MDPQSYLIPIIYPFYFIHTVSYYGGFPEGKMEYLVGQDQDKYIFYFEDVYNKKVLVEKLAPAKVITGERMKRYIDNASEDGFVLVGVRLPHTRHIITARDVI